MKIGKALENNYEFNNDVTQYIGWESLLSEVKHYSMGLYIDMYIHSILSEKHLSVDPGIMMKNYENR